MVMDRRKFFKRLGLTAAVAAIAPRLLAEETIQPNAEYVAWFDYDNTIQGLGGTNEDIFVQGEAVISNRVDDSGPYLHLIYDDKDTIKFPYKQAWKRPVVIKPGVTIMYLPRQLAWAKNMIIIRDENEDFSTTIETDGTTDIYCMMVNSIKVDGFEGGPIGSPMQIIQDGKWLK